MEKKNPINIEVEINEELAELMLLFDLRVGRLIKAGKLTRKDIESMQILQALSISDHYAEMEKVERVEE
jgi:hypothetical protein